MKKRLNLGSGKTYMEGFINVDVNPKFKPDIVEDMMKVKFKFCEFDEVYAKDVIDHVTYSETRVLLRKILGWLKPGGLLFIHTPNLDHLIHILRASSDDKLRHQALKWLYGTDGEGSTAYFSNKIRWCFNAASLRKMLQEVGFKVMSCGTDCGGFGLTLIAKKWNFPSFEDKYPPLFKKTGES